MKRQKKQWKKYLVRAMIGIDVLEIERIKNIADDEKKLKKYLQKMK